jgi:hypothetical protein
MKRSYIRYLEAIISLVDNNFKRGSLFKFFLFYILQLVHINAVTGDFL